MPLFPLKLLGARNKAENLRPHPAVDNSPRLPIEVIGIVLSHLRGDHHALSRCMRVSTKIYEVAAPHLYYDIVLQDPKYTEDWMPRAYPNGTVFHGFEQDHERIVPTKRRLMQHIKHVTVCWSQFTWSYRGQAQHTAGFTWSRKFINTHFPTFDTPLEIDTMCISIPHCFLIRPSGYGIPKTPPEDAPDSYPYLALWERFRPKKIILFGTLGRESILWTPTYPPLRRLPAGLETLVTHFNCANAADYDNRYDAYRGCQTLRKLIYIVSDAPVDDPVPSPVHDGSIRYWSWHIHDRHMSLGQSDPFSGLCQLVRECQTAALEVEYQGEIMVVNWKGVGSPMNRDHDLFSRLRDEDNTPSNAERIKKIRFMTMREYLTTQDWTKEFTDDEARAWLEVDPVKDRLYYVRMATLSRASAFESDITFLCSDIGRADRSSWDILLGRSEMAGRKD